MEYSDFEKCLEEEMNKVDIKVDEKKCKRFYYYMQLLLEWNNKINLTSIIAPKEIIIKHFVDSLTVNKFIDKKLKILDVGSGAGFPGMPLAINNEDIDITLMDSLNKRINFLNDVKENLKLENVTNIHGRAEEMGQNREYREKYDIVMSRAVAPLNVLLEYLIPFTKVGGCCICMKGPGAQEEIENAKNALKTLGAEIYSVESFMINDELTRNIIVVRKVEKTKKEFPRKAGTPGKKPL